MYFLDEPLEDIQRDLAVDPPPGIDPIPEARVVSKSESSRSGECVAGVEMSLESFVRSSVQYDIDPYQILADVKRDAGPEAAVAALELLRSGTLTTAVITTTPDEVVSDQWPANPDL
jgi:hypothetical protein